jgi:DNA-binding NarL/FixJ family response regulator
MASTPSSTPRPVTVLIVDDHATFAQALSHAVGAEPDIEVVGVAIDAAAGARSAHTLRPDVVLLDHRIGTDDGVELARQLHQELSGTTIVMLTATTDETVALAALEAGCAGYLVKDAPLSDVISAVHSAARGDAVVPPALLAKLLPHLRDREPRTGALTDREMSVLRLLDQGLSSAAIATELTISLNTVRNHVQNILNKLGAHSKLEAVAKARESGLLGAGPQA